MDPNPVKDFFISYNKADRVWAEWIGWHLEQEGYSCILQAWDFLPGGNFVLDMQHAATYAQRTIAVFSPDYLTALYTQPEWAAAFVQDPTGKDGKLLPVRVRECKPEGILAAIVYIDLFKLDESAARAALLAGVKRTRAKPTGPLPFPGAASPTPKLPISFPGNWSEVWEVPYRRNTFFTGRDELLERLYNELTTHNKTMALTQTQAISGLGGIGKTQTALEYAYRHQHEYRYILWATADTAEGLSAAYVKFAELLQVPGRDEKDQQRTIQAFKHWLAHQRDWLLILDNADDVLMVRDFLPDDGPHMNGHIILTTRAQALGSIANAIDIEKMGKEEGVHFLLKRVKSNSTTSTERAAAETIVEELDGLPLALDQAGAYVEETGCSLAAYLKFYETRREDLLKRRGRLVKDHPETVATTWSISLQKVEEENPAAVALLKLCAFLAPDAIQEEMIVKGAGYLGEDLNEVAADEFLLNEAIEVLRRYSLVKRNKETNSLSIHRLVQVVLKDEMSYEEQRQWTERAIQVVGAVFPFGIYENWEQCRRYLPHAQMCIKMIERDNVESLQAAYLLRYVGYYFYAQRDYMSAEKCYLLALQIQDKIFGLDDVSSDNASFIRTLRELGSVYQDQGKYTEAENIYREIIITYEEMPEIEPADMNVVLHELGSVYQDQGKYAEAERQYYELIDNMSELENSDSASTLHELGRLYQQQGRYEEAEALYQRVLLIDKKVRGGEHPDTATTFYRLGSLYHVQEKNKEAETFYEQAIEIYEKTIGFEHPDTINAVKCYVRLFYKAHRIPEAEALLIRANLTWKDLLS